MSEDCFLKLSQKPLRFSPLSPTTRVFYDPDNKQIFSVHSGTEMGVILQNTETHETFEFRLKNTAPIIGIRLAPDHKILAIQRSKSTIEFYEFPDAVAVGDQRILLDHEIMKNCKRNSIILGFLWTSAVEIVFVTNHGIEMYKIDFAKQSFSLLKKFKQNCDWFLWSSQSHLAILASAHGVNLIPVVIRAGFLAKLPKLEVEQNRIIVERDVTLCEIYGKPAVLILKHQNYKCDQISVYLMTDDSAPDAGFVRAHNLNLTYSGKFGINIVDNLIVVHHQRERKSIIFDVNLSGASDAFVTYHEQFVTGREIEPFDLNSTLNQNGGNSHESRSAKANFCDLYNPHWVMLQPNIVMDTKLGCFWYLESNLVAICKSVKDLRVSIQLALSRTNGKHIILEELFRYFNKYDIKMDILKTIFDSINTPYRIWLDRNLNAQLALPVHEIKSKMQRDQPLPVVITQNDMMSNAIDKCPFVVKDFIMLEYIRSLISRGIPIDNHVCNEILRILVLKKKHVNLIQLIQYRVFRDSIQLAQTLLVYGQTITSLNQLAIDMLYRLNAVGVLEEYFLNRGQIMYALRYVSAASDRNYAAIAFHKYLMLAKQMSDSTVYQNVLDFLKTDPRFQDQIGEIDKAHNDLFVDESDSTIEVANVAQESE